MCIRDSSPWYSPSTLYKSINSSMHTQLSDEELQSFASLTPEVCERTIDVLLRAPMSFATVRDLGDSACIDAVRTLTQRTFTAARSGDEAVSRIAEKDLATALLRWVLLRDE